MTGMSREAGIQQVYGGGHVVILGAGASIATTIRNAELNGKRLPSMDNFIDIVGLQDLFHQAPDDLKASNFESFYTNLHNADPNNVLLDQIQRRVQTYFGDMKLPAEPTIYDYMVLSLRDKDLIATFNWDPFLYQAWSRNRVFTKNLPFLSFLHGNVAIGYCAEDKVCGPVGYYVRNDGGKLEPTQLLYPIEQKNYNDDPFIKSEWERVKYWMSKDSGAKRVTIFGYGAPTSDVEAVSLLNESWGTPNDRAMEQFEIVDVVDEDILRERWSGFIHSHHYDISKDYFSSSLAMNPRRTSESYFSHIQPLTIDEAFRNNNPVPTHFESLEELWDWHRSLTEAEEATVNETIIQHG